MRPDPAGTPAGARAHVHDLDHIPSTGVFALTTAATHLELSADHLAVPMEPVGTPALPPPPTPET